jgi:hypothetical protein
VEALSLTNGTVDLLISLDYGPRILRYGYVDGRNVLAKATTTINTPSGPWCARGGHRLWVAPESVAGSYAPDNDPVEYDTSGALAARFRQRTDAAGIQKEIAIAVAESGTSVTITHRITNRLPWMIAVAPWAISIVTSDATAVIPQPVFRSHESDLLPVRPIVQWSFTDLTDPRWRIGRRLLCLTPDSLRPAPQKIGVGNPAGWCALVRRDLIFMKRFGWNPRAAYADFGCNNELYTAGDFLEVETLGPMAHLSPDYSVDHVERWSLFPAAAVASTQDGLTDELSLADQLAAAAEGQGHVDVP